VNSQLPMQAISQRLEAVRAQMAERNLDALVVPRADEYLGEYIPAHNERMLWVSGFTGSAGVVIVLRESAVIFVDGRYTVQVRQQVSEELFEILSLVEQPPMKWLSEQLGEGAQVGYDSRMHPLNWQRGSNKILGKAGQSLVALEDNLIDLCWLDRPLAKDRPALLLAEEYSGQSSASKREEIGALIEAAGAEAAYIFAADSCNWLLNIRGGDVPNLPIVLGSAILHRNGQMQFFCDPAKIPDGFSKHVGPSVEVHPEQDLLEMFGRLEGSTVLCDPATANAWAQLSLEACGVTVLAADDPTILPKACKNSVEVQGMRNAHIRDGAAESQFLAWLDREVASGNLHDEAALSDKLGSLRALQPQFLETSFDTISAAAGNAAMCHYNHLNATPAKLALNGVYLVDSGGQYLDGTTDITRTVAIGEPSEEIRERFTLVLKGMIALDQVRFPEGTSGGQLDIMARQFLWQQGLDYAHGTGHGVGSCLSVHEGPQRIGTAGSEVALKPGMVVSDEPGYYKDERYGMRCENLLVVVEISPMQDTDKMLLGFETLTMAPFDKRMLVLTMLTAAELRWLNTYHTKVFSAVGPLLEGDDLDWLERATSPLSV
jgi:Xaa-Pro aminopeptidase